MPNPKRRHSKTRSKKRRTHYKAALPTLTACRSTGVVHRRHTAYVVDGNIYYAGNLFAEGKSSGA